MYNTVPMNPVFCAPMNLLMEVIVKIEKVQIELAHDVIGVLVRFQYIFAQLAFSTLDLGNHKAAAYILRDGHSGGPQEGRVAG